MADGQTLEAGSARESMSALATVQAHLGAHRWADAAQVLAALPSRQSSEQFQLNICRNLAAMKQFRPTVYQAILHASEPERYTVGAAASGHPTIFHRADDGSQVPLSPGNQPVAALSSTFASIKEPYQAGRAMAILGMGDGYLLKSCALNPPALAFGTQQAVYLLEPDAQAVLACMTIHDYTGADGPIEQERFIWCVGGEFMAAARECLIGEQYNPAPVIEVSQSPNSRQIGVQLKALLAEQFSLFKKNQASVSAYYAAIAREQWREVFGANPPRTPRVLLVTTRCSSVLQYSTRDAAEGFQAIGWEPRIFIEPKPHHAFSAAKIIEIVAEFQPDLIFQIDHLRSEWNELFPLQLPFVCWVQDHMSSLTNTAAGASVTSRDFLLCGMPGMYTDRFGYPARQFLQLPKLTRIPLRPASGRSDGDDLVYVSSASAVPRERAMEIVKGQSESSPARRILAGCCERMIAHYETGGSLPMIGSIEPLLAETEGEVGIAITDPEARRRTLETLFDRLNNALYRQQAMRWAKSIAGRHGLKLSVYGPGWDRNPEYASYARGTILYGEPLESLTRSSKINLVLEPTLNISHQRLLDALVAGGFCLIRHHPANVLFQNFLNFLTRHAPPSACTVGQVRAALAGESREAFERQLDGLAEYAVLGDPVTHMRGLRNSEILLDRPEALPNLSDVSFNSESEMEALVLSFLADEGKRREIARRQRIDVEARFSYAHGMKRVTAWIGNLLAEEGR